MLAFALLVGVPLVELLLIIEVGGTIGAGATILICILTGVVGAQLARTQGSSVMARMRREVSEGRIPARELVDGVLILVAAALLLTPGYITDVVGMLLLVPVTRALVRPFLVRWARARMVTGGNVHVGGFGGPGPFGPGGPGPFGPGGPFEPPPDGASRDADPGGPDQEIIPPGQAGGRQARPRPKVITVD